MKYLNERLRLLRTRGQEKAVIVTGKASVTTLALTLRVNFAQKSALGCEDLKTKQFNNIILNKIKKGLNLNYGYGCTWFQQV